MGEVPSELHRQTGLVLKVLGVGWLSFKLYEISQGSGTRAAPNPPRSVH